eukprot:COSAG04_NODE_8881_length_921_cov_1.116788_1_plen_94_part_01
MNAAVHRRIACLRSQLAASAERHPGQVRQPRWSVLTDAEQMRIIDVRIPPGARAEVRHEVATLRWPARNNKRARTTQTCRFTWLCGAKHLRPLL